MFSVPQQEQFVLSSWISGPQTLINDLPLLFLTNYVKGQRLQDWDELPLDLHPVLLLLVQIDGPTAEIVTGDLTLSCPGSWWHHTVNKGLFIVKPLLNGP